MAFAVPSAIGNLLGLDSGETWRDRLKEGAYKSPKKGTRIRYLYADLSMKVDARGTVWEFPGVNGAYVQRTGFGARTYPMRVFFSGPDHDKVGTAFLAALLEPGIGTLEHPLYGTFKVTPFGDITRRDDLVRAANESVFDVSFLTTFENVYPSGKADAQDEIQAALGNFDVEAAQKFQDGLDLDGPGKIANLKGTVRGFLQDVSAALQSVSDTTASVKREFDDYVRLINQGIDVFIGQPLLLAQQIDNLIKAPGRALAGILSRLEGYAALADRIFGSKAGSPADLDTIVAGRFALVANDFEAAELFATYAVAGSVNAVLNNEFSTRPEALRAAQRIAAKYDELVAWQDTQRVALSNRIDEGAAYQALRDAVALTLGQLVQASFTLVPERRIVLDRERTPIDLCAELYGEVDARLDLLISSNSLTGDEIFLLPAGKSVLYYPD